MCLPSHTLLAHIMYITVFSRTMIHNEQKHRHAAVSTAYATSSPRRAAAPLSMAAAAAADTKPVRVAILGASGYTGAELVRLLLGHTGVEISVLTGNTQAGQAFSAVYPQFHYSKVRRTAAAAAATDDREDQKSCFVLLFFCFSSPLHIDALGCASCAAMVFRWFSSSQII